MLIFVCVHLCWLTLQLLDEMLDDGYPAVMEPNVLREIIKPPSLLRKLQDQIMGESTL